MLENVRFRPALIPSLVALLFLILLLKLGFWQLHRAEQKRDIYNHYLQQKDSPARALGLLLDSAGNGEDLLWRNIEVSGTVSSEFRVYLDNRVVKTVSGYDVFEALNLSFKPEKWLLINRGWVPVGADRSQLPEMGYGDYVMPIRGRAVPLPVSGILLSEESNLESFADGIYRMQSLDLEKLSAHTKHDFLPFVLQLDADQAGMLQPNWRTPGSGQEKHLGYAFQWFALAFALCVIYLKVNLKPVRSELNESGNSE